MNRLIAVIVTVTLFVLGGWALWQRAETATARAVQLEQQRDAALERERQKDSVIDTLRVTAANLERQRRAAAKTQAALERTASNRLEQIREIQRNDDNTKDWAGTRLPDAVIRLRSHAAITGADAYRQAVRDAEPLQPAGEQPNHQR